MRTRLELENEALEKFEVNDMFERMMLLSPEEVLALLERPGPAPYPCECGDGGHDTGKGICLCGGKIPNA